jgi:hypothetical protein
MRYRKLRIAWSVGCGIICLLLIALWVRSYWRIDGANGFRGRHFVYFDLHSGRFSLSRVILTGPPPPPWRAFNNLLMESDIDADANEAKLSHSALGFRCRIVNNGWRISVPLWFPAFVASGLTVAPWMYAVRWRFGLRTLLVGMTLVAVVLGAVVWASK